MRATEGSTNMEEKGGIKFDIELEQQPFPVGFNEIFNALELSATHSQ